MTDPSSGKRAQRPKLRRTQPADRPPLRLTPRDRAIITVVYRCRALTTDQIIRLLFSDVGQSDRVAQRRLQRLFHHGYLFRDEQPHKSTEGKPYLYFLDEAGAQLLCQDLQIERRQLDWSARNNDVTALFLDHLLATNDIRIALSLAAREHGFTIDIWIDDSSLRKRETTQRVLIRGPEGGRLKIAVVPDGYFKLTTPADTFNFFLEIDRRTTTGQSSKWGRRDWSRKVAGYKALYESGAYEQRYGTADMRVLTITTGTKRLENLQQITEATAQKQAPRFWFTTFEAAQAESILTKTIWSVAGRTGKHAIESG